SKCVRRWALALGASEVPEWGGAKTFRSFIHLALVRPEALGACRRRVLALVLHGSGTVWGSVRVPTALAFSREAKVAGMRAKPVEMVANGDWLLFGKE